MAKGKVLKDDQPWSTYPSVKNGVQLLLMGVAEGKELKQPIQIDSQMSDLEKVNVTI